MLVGTAVHSFLMEPVFKPKIQTQAGSRGGEGAVSQATQTEPPKAQEQHLKITWVLRPLLSLVCVS